MTRPFTCFLRIGDDDLSQARRFKTKGAAIDAYLETARELARVEQSITADLHYADCREELTDDPDTRLSLGPQGGLVQESY